MFCLLNSFLFVEQTPVRGAVTLSGIPLYFYWIYQNWSAKLLQKILRCNVCNG